MPASPALLGIFFCFAATVLLIFVSISPPTWDKISFLNVRSGGREIRYGLYGRTGSRTSIGYRFIPESSGVNTNVIANLTKALILNTIAAVFAGLAFLFGLCGAARYRVGTFLMAALAWIATVITLFVWVYDMSLFGIVRGRYRDRDIPAEYGNANWLVLGALVALLLAACTGTCGIFGRHSKRHY